MLDTNKYVLEFLVASEKYRGKIMIPSNKELNEDQILKVAPKYLRDHLKEVFEVYGFVAELSILQAYDRKMK